MHISLVINRIRSLYNIDKHKVDAALMASGHDPLSEDDWMRFRDNPSRYFINSDGPTSAAIWCCVEARQKTDPVTDLIAAAKGVLADDDAGTSLSDQRDRWNDRMAVLRAALSKAEGV